jgi:hypothetical protein
MEERSQGRLCVYMHLGILTATGRPAATDALTVILLGFTMVAPGGCRQGSNLCSRPRRP